MAQFFKKYKIILLVVSCGLSLLGLASAADGNEEALVVFTIPGVMLGIYTYLINSKGKIAFKGASDADELVKWSQLRESGAISNDEYEKKKKEILG
jgi:hypothetical protein